MEEFWIIASEYFEKSDEWALHFLRDALTKKREQRTLLSL
jgi:hypothetical protein